MFSRKIPSQYWLRVLMAPLGMIPTISWPAIAREEPIEQLKGTTYITLPEEICPYYTDMLLRQTDQQPTYGGVICDRPESSYILLQKLLKHTEQGKAVWEVIQVKKVLKPNPQSFITGIGCYWTDQNSAQPKEPIFALIQATKANTYSTLAAWKVDFAEPLLVDLTPQQVTCKDPEY